MFVKSRLALQEGGVVSSIDFRRRRGDRCWQVYPKFGKVKKEPLGTLRRLKDSPGKEPQRPSVDWSSVSAFWVEIDYCNETDRFLFEARLSDRLVPVFNQSWSLSSQRKRTRKPPA